VASLQSHPDKILLNKWNHVACSYSGSQAKLYVNGKLADQTSSTGFLFYNPTQVLRIGESWASPSSFPGYIDRVAIYNEAF